MDLFQSPMDNIKYIYQNQEILSLFVSAVKWNWSSNSGLLQIEALIFFVFSKYRVEEDFKMFFCVRMLFFRSFLAHKKGLIHSFTIMGAAKIIPFFFANLVYTIFQKKSKLSKIPRLGFWILIKKKVHYSFDNHKIPVIVFLIFFISGAIYIEILQHRRLFIKIRNMEGIWTRCAG